MPQSQAKTLLPRRVCKAWIPVLSFCLPRFVPPFQKPVLVPKVPEDNGHVGAWTLPCTYSHLHGLFTEGSLLCSSPSGAHRLLPSAGWVDGRRRAMALETGLELSCAWTPLAPTGGLLQPPPRPTSSSYRRGAKAQRGQGLARSHTASQRLESRGRGLCVWFFKQQT